MLTFPLCFLYCVIVLGECVCNMCFTRNSSGMCTTCSDYRYSSSQAICGLDNRPKQLTAFLLSLFLSSTGAANFYIGQNNLGNTNIKRKLTFLLLLLLFLFFGSFNRKVPTNNFKFSVQRRRKSRTATETFELKNIYIIYIYIIYIYIYDW